MTVRKNRSGSRVYHSLYQLEISPWKQFKHGSTSKLIFAKRIAGTPLTRYWARAGHSTFVMILPLTVLDSLDLKLGNN